MMFNVGDEVEVVKADDTGWGEKWVGRKGTVVRLHDNVGGTTVDFGDFEGGRHHDRVAFSWRLKHVDKSPLEAAIRAYIQREQANAI